MFFDETKNKKYKCEKYLDNLFITPKIKVDYEKYHSKIDDLKNLYHLFLKYTYTNNWKTEIKENYFSVDYNFLIDGFVQNNFKCLFDHKYTLPFKKQEILKNFNYKLKLPTHRNLIFVR
jgi:hypothetical protein